MRTGMNRATGGGRGRNETSRHETEERDEQGETRGARRKVDIGWGDEWQEWVGE